LACALAGLEYLDPHDDVQHLLERIARSRLVLAEAMHAAIVADALRIPWIPIKVHDHIDAFKWRDWCASMELEYQPAEILPLLSGSPALHRRLQSKLLPYLLGSKLRRIARDNATFLSSDGVLERQKDRLLSLTRDVS
jgi:succinoglycan biosynthesis protein ExoV